MSVIPAAPARPSATVVVVREAAGNPELLLVRRRAGDAFGDSYTFPGGVIDPDESAALEYCEGRTADEANALLGMAGGALDYFSAAIRELFEETGILLARNGVGDWAPDTASMEDLRVQVDKGELPWPEFLRRQDLRMACDAIQYFAWWETPRFSPKRWSTRFFVAELPAGQIASHDGRELTDSLWITAADALARGEEGNLNLPFPTRRSLREMAAFCSVGDLLEWARKRPQSGISKVRPARIGQRGDTTFAIPGDPGYIEEIASAVRRMLAPNPGMMTGPGTNTYLLGEKEIAVVDPGPLIEAHVDAIVEASDRRIRWVLVTHTHPDHSPAACKLAQQTGAELIGRPAPEGESQDSSFRPDRVLSDGETLTTEEFTLKAVHTPGHASNHLCYLHEQTGLLFTGDHIMNGSTVVIDPPDGNMRQYLESLDRLKSLEIIALAPGHGELMFDYMEAVDALIAHRLKREAKVVAALEDHPASTLEELVASVYKDVGAHLHKLAERSLLAHLLKLEEEGRAVEQDGTWQLVSETPA